MSSQEKAAIVESGAERLFGAIAITDVYGFTAAVSEVEEEALIRVLGDLREFTAITGRHGGRVLADRGDGLKLFFPSAVEAMRASLEMQAFAFERNRAAGPGDRRVQHRIGLHVGDVATLGDVTSGMAVAVAARLQEFATPGTVAYSLEVHRAVAQALRLNARFTGSQHFKNLPFGVGTYLARPDVDTAFDDLGENDMAAIKGVLLERHKIDWDKADRLRKARQRTILGLAVFFLIVALASVIAAADGLRGFLP